MRTERRKDRLRRLLIALTYAPTFATLTPSEYSGPSGSTFALGLLVLIAIGIGVSRLFPKLVGGEAAEPEAANATEAPQAVAPATTNDFDVLVNHDDPVVRYGAELGEAALKFVQVWDLARTVYQRKRDEVDQFDRIDFDAEDPTIDEEAVLALLPDEPIDFGDPDDFEDVED